MKDREVVKIGYAKYPKDRWRAIRIGNIHVELIDFKLGALRDERELHKLCDKWHVEGEWFTDCKEVREIWNNYQRMAPTPFEQFFHLYETEETLKCAKTTPINYKDHLNEIYLEIYRVLPKTELTSEEVAEYLDPVFNKYHVRSNKDQSVILSECSTKRRKTTKKRSYTLYDFNKLRFIIDNMQK